MNLLLQRLLDHNLYATRLTLETCRGLSADQFHQRFEIGPGSLHDTLRHVVGAMLRWSDRIMHREVRPSIEQPGARFSVDDLLRLLEQGDREFRAAAQDAEARLDQTMSVQFAPQMPVMQFTRASALVHVATHGAHHRAQALNMLRRLGVTDRPHLDALAAERGP